MNSNKRNAINDFADQVIKILEITPRVDMENIVKVLSGDIQYAEEIDGREASIEKIDEGDLKFRITLPLDAHERRNRFTIAHELGHLFLHMGYLVDEDKWDKTPYYKDSAYYRSGHSAEEYEANEFAGALLMPRKEFIRIAKENLEDDYYNVSKIADYFDVSVKAAKVRGRFLGLFEWS